MGANSKIEWTDATWNPVVGCQKVSPGCKNCYAKALHDKRHAAYKAGAKVPPQYALPFEAIQVMPDRLTQPLSWRQPKRIFVNSVSDLFHEDVPDDFLDRVFAVMALAGRHTFQVLTKRPERMAKYAEQIRRPFDHADHWKPVRVLDALNGLARFRGETIHELIDDFGAAVRGGLPNVWLGTSVENQSAADERIPHLLRCPAAVRFLSCEPLLGEVRLDRIFTGVDPSHSPPYSFDARFRGLHWVICGGESGPGARPMHPDWARSLRDQCQAAGVAFHFKQWGEFIHPHPSELHLSPAPAQEWQGIMIQRVGKKAAGRLLDGREWNEFPEPRA